MVNKDNATKPHSKDNRIFDPWRNYRIVVGILTAAVPFLFFYILYFIQMIFEFFKVIIGFFTMPNMGGSPPSFSKDPNSGIIIFTALCFLIFATAGYRYTKNSANSRSIIWIASILSLPFGIFSIWVLNRTTPGTYNTPPNKRVVVAITIGILIFAIVAFGPMVIENIKQTKDQLERQDSEFIQHIDYNNVEELRDLLEKGANSNQTTKLGTTALMFALEQTADQGYSYGQIRISESAALLLEFGADPNTPSRWQQGVEYEALVSRMRDDESLKRWLNFDKLKKSYNKHTPLVVASELGDPALVALMIEKGADVNAHQTYTEVKSPLIKHLLERGERVWSNYLADDHPELSPLATALREAITRNQLGAVHVLLNHGAAMDTAERSLIEDALDRVIRYRPKDLNPDVRVEIERILSTK